MVQMSLEKKASQQYFFTIADETPLYLWIILKFWFFRFLFFFFCFYNLYVYKCHRFKLSLLLYLIYGFRKYFVGNNKSVIP